MASVMVTYENKDYGKQIEYVFKFIFYTYGIQYTILPYSEFARRPNVDYELLISYGKKRIKNSFDIPQIHIYESHLFGEYYLTPESLPYAPLQRFNDLPIIYYGSKKVEGHVRREGGLLETDIDIIASSFFMLSRYEEVLVNERDKFGRFPATASLAYKEGFLDRPIVNEYIELLWTWIDSFGLGFQRREPWGGKKFAVCLTHDVDSVKKYRAIPPLLTLKRVFLERKDLRAGLSICADYLGTLCGFKTDPYQITFDYLIELEDEHKIKSSFYFMTDGERYSVKDQFILKLIGELEDNGFEIGLHAGFSSYDNAEALKREKERLEEVTNRPIRGNRQHYLRWKTPDTWRALEKAGFQYDTTLGFADHTGFRCGVCYPYKPFDVVEGRVLDIWEVPLIVMEVTLFQYEGLSEAESIERIKEMLAITERAHGLFVTLWHNSSFYRVEDSRSSRVYVWLLQYIREKGALVSTVQEALEIWQAGRVI